MDSSMSTVNHPHCMGAVAAQQRSKLCMPPEEPVVGEMEIWKRKTSGCSFAFQTLKGKHSGATCIKLTVAHCPGSTYPHVTSSATCDPWRLVWISVTDFFVFDPPPFPLARYTMSGNPNSMPTSPLPIGSTHLTVLLSALADVDFRQKDLAAAQWRLKQVALATFGVPVGVATLASASHRRRVLLVDVRQLGSFSKPLSLPPYLHTYFPGQGVASPAGANAGVVPSSFLSPGPSVEDAFQVLFSRRCCCFVQSRNSKADLLNSQLASSPFTAINTQNQWRHASHMRGAVGTVHSVFRWGMYTDSDIPAAGPPTTTPLHSLNHAYTVPAAAPATTSISTYTPASMNTTSTRYCERETSKQSSRHSTSGMAKMSMKRTTASVPGSLSASIPAMSHPPFTEKCTRMAKRMNQNTKVVEIQGTVGYSRSHAGHAPAMGDGYSEADSSAANAGRLPLRRVKPEDWLV
ncbi:hypothetical protein K438DRAFT_1774966 [Mycena galopus ATCC 62051]|nr:hypothetical protein K438DRAFT_1774966 [Mycena galopus ATCC 62051]